MSVDYLRNIEFLPDVSKKFIQHTQIFYFKFLMIFPIHFFIVIKGFRSSGTLKVGEYSITYSYTIEEDNKNNRSLRKFATGANREYRENRVGAYHSEFQKFVVYYGVPDFSDKIIMGALDNQIVQFTNAGTFNFKELGFVGRSIATQISALMITVLQLIGELENAVEECQTCSFPMETCSAVNSIDQAVAYYVGSLAQGLGNLMYTLADFSCMDFKTCGFAGESFFGASSVNLELFPSFEIMKYSIIEQQCSRARTHKDLLISKLFVPLIQSTLKSLYEMESLDHPTEEAEAQAFMYATSILPLVHNCNPKDASSILNHVRIGQEGKGRFAAVKKALENNYVCMKVTCEEIGGYYDGSVSRYYPGAEPCDYQSVMS